MTSQAMYCLSLQIRPPEATNAVNTANNGPNEQSEIKSASIDSDDTLIVHGLEDDGESAVKTNFSIATENNNLSNIILVRGAQSENGHIILQNGHELLSLLNGDDENNNGNKTFILQSQKVKPLQTSGYVASSGMEGGLNGNPNGSSSTNIESINNIKNGIVFHHNNPVTIKATSENNNKPSTITTDGSTSLSTSKLVQETSRILVQTPKKQHQQHPQQHVTTLGDGSILLHSGNMARGADGPILLQTLKRLDKSSILVFRNASQGKTILSSHPKPEAATANGHINLIPTTVENIRNAKNQSEMSTVFAPTKSGRGGSNSINTRSATLTKREQQKAQNMNVDKMEQGKGTDRTISKQTTNIPLGTDGEPIKLPDNLESLPRADHFPTQRHRWNTNEEIAAILISFDKHSEWQSKEVRTRPKSGCMLLYSRKKVRYRRDGYCWKKRKDGKTTREDHMKLKVQGTECIYGCYVHSAILPTFHRRCYWLLQNPDIVLVHYLNVPYPDDNKMAVIAPSLALWGDKKEWTKEELVSQLKPMFFSEDEPDATNDIEISTSETVEAIVSQLMEKQRQARQAALVKQLECGCPDSTCADGKSCSHPMRRVTAAKNKRAENHNQVSSTTPNVLIGPRGYQRWRTRDQMMTDSKDEVVYQSGIAITTGTVTAPSPSSTTASVTSANQSVNITNGHNISSGNSSCGSSGSINSNSTTASGHHQQTQQLLHSGVGGPGPHQQQQNQHHLNHQSQSLQSLHNPSIVGGNNCGGDNGDSTPHAMVNGYHTRTSAVNLLGGDRLSTANNNGTGLPSRTSTATSSSSVPLAFNLSQIHNSNSVAGGQSYMCQSNLDKESNVPTMLNMKQELTDSLRGGENKTHSMDIPFDGQFCSNTNSPRKQNPFNPNNEVDNESMAYFNETLDLSHEDIQKTLSANMPMGNGAIVEVNGSGTAGTAMDGELNPMDFIDNVAMCEVSHHSVHDEDLFVNLDAFDMFVEFPEFDSEAKSHFCNSNGTSVDQSGDNSLKTSMLHAIGDCKEASDTDVAPGNDSLKSQTITDYSPEWAYPEGGVKVLVTGPWTTNTSYTVLFDSFPVPTTVVQNGVLRCFCPAHDVGLATLQVASNGYVVSNSVMFEYKSQPKVESVVAEGTSSDGLYKFNLLNRLEALDERMQIKCEPKEMCEDSALFNQSNFEDRLVTYCQSLAMRQWNQALSNWYDGPRGMTLLHLASALGYTKLVCTMLKWRCENSSFILETEVDALNQDSEGFTPLMWACARGHNETASVLYKWNRKAMNLRNIRQLTALDLAKNNGHETLVIDLRRLGDNQDPSVGETDKTFAGLKDNELDDDSTTTSPSKMSRASSSSERSHDGVFLRPGAVSQNGQSPPLTQRIVKRTSVDSGIGVEINRFNALRTGKSIKELQKLARSDRSMSLPLSSYINMELNDPFSLSCDGGANAAAAAAQMDNRTNKLLSSHSLLSPLRKMDFALCEVSAGETSPNEQADALADEEDGQEEGGGDPGQNHQDNICENMVQEGGVVGESDVKVLTLAEQIIAAIPDRIKNESEEIMSLGSPLPDSLMSDTASMLNDTFMEPLLDQMPNTSFDHEFNFEFSDHSYRYHDAGTPCSSLSPASSGPMQSPASYTVHQDPPMGSPSPPPTTQDFTEFFQASSSTPKPFEADFSNLTLTDLEQRELYEAAKCIQKAYRSYKGRKKLEEQDKERTAAIVIQNYYRRYKQYIYYRQMTHAALVIQNGYRSYCENKRFKKSQCANQASPSSSSTNSECLQNFHQNYKQESAQLQSSSSTPKELSPSGPLKRTYSQRTQNQAARKIQQFMRQSKMKLQKERAEKEKLIHQHKAEYHRNLQYPGSQGPASNDLPPN